MSGNASLVALSSIVYSLDDYGLLKQTLIAKIGEKVESDAEIFKKAQQLAGAKSDVINKSSSIKAVSTLCGCTEEKQNYFVLNAVSDNKKFDAFESYIETIAKRILELPDIDDLDIFYDNLDSLLSIHGHCLPSYGDAPLYDFLKLTSAFAVALKINSQQSSKKTSPFLLIQGDFFGIQRFIFSASPEHNKKMAQILRGKSAGVSILMELCAIRLVESLGLSPASVIRCSAGKLLLLAPNTDEIIVKLCEAKKDIEQWFLSNFFGEFGIILSFVEADELEFSTNKESTKNTKSLMSKALAEQELSKTKKFDINNMENAVFDDYLNMVSYNGLCPACERRAKVKSGELCSVCGAFQKLGSKLADANQKFIWIIKNSDKDTFAPFGYEVVYQKPSDTKIVRCWDVELPNKDGNIWHSIARRTFKAYIPYAQTFDDLANAAEGKDALIALKADIDNLGDLFANKINKDGIASFARISALSREINHFFTHHISYLLSYANEKYKNIYTIFAGGDDLFLIGPWDAVLDFVKTLKKEFDKYFEAKKTNMSFSAGLVMFKSGVPVPHVAHAAEKALENAKDFEGKGAICVFGETVKFEHYDLLCDISKELSVAVEDFKLKTNYLRTILEYCELSKDAESNIYATKWKSHFRYSSSRNVLEGLKAESKNAAEKFVSSLGAAIEYYKTALKIPIFQLLYKKKG